MAPFTGFLDAALDFFEGLEADNSKTYWTAHKAVWEQSVRDPMQALLDDLEPEFGSGAMFRPYRDVRFSRDKSPYKTQIGATAGGAKRDAVYYVQLGPDGLMAAAGMYGMASDQVTRLREAVDDDRTGAEVERIVADLHERGYDVGGQELKTVPRGFERDHPRAELLRHKALFGWQHLGAGPWLSTAKARDRVVDVWRGTAELQAWLRDNVGSPRS